MGKVQSIETIRDVKFMWFGGDYNPDQWDEATINRDMELFKKAHINLVVLPVFSWAKLEPEEGRYDFLWLDRILEILEKNKISVCLANATAAQPAWMSVKYPEILPIDRAGRKREHGMRMFYCVNSSKFRERAAALTEQFGARYKDYKGLAAWHVANEYGTYCYCENCQRKFREWLKKRYHTVSELNERWYTAFWGRTVYSFDEIMLPTELNDDYRFSPAIALDYKRFMTDSTMECFQNEADILRRYTPDIPIFSNISGHIENLDQFKMTERMDYAGWDNYPSPHEAYSMPAMKLDLMRGLKNGRPFLITEQAPNQQNWQPYNKLKRPGEMRTLAYQGLGHGGDSCMFFQMRQSAAGQEKFHSAVISHADREDTRTFCEVSKLGEELDRISGAFLGGCIRSEVGFLFDWDNWWALELASGPTKDMDYLKQVHTYYQAFCRKNISVDFLHPDRDFRGYKVLVAPLLYMVEKETARRLEIFVKNGGTLIATYMTGVADRNDRCIFGAYPGNLRELFGIWVEVSDALCPEEKNCIRVLGGHKRRYSCSFLCDLLHVEDARVVAVYDSDFYQGSPCVTVKETGQGKAYYLATQPEDAYLDELTEEIMRDSGIDAPFGTEGEVEVCTRIKEGKKIYFVINHGDKPGKVFLNGGPFVDLISGKIADGEAELEGREVMVLQTWHVHAVIR